MVATQVKVKLVNEQFMGEFYFRKDQEATARSLLKDGWYRDAGEFAVMGTGEDAAEEVFDLTNNPSRDASGTTNCSLGGFIITDQPVVEQIPAAGSMAEPGGAA